MERKVVSVFAWLVILVLAVSPTASYAQDKAVVFTSIEEGGIVPIYSGQSLPVKYTLKGKITGFSQEEIAAQGLTVEVFILDVAQGPVPVDKKGKWESETTVKSADIVIKAVLKDKAGKELAATSIKATASGEF
jgi:hypothetical protein